MTHSLNTDIAVGYIQENFEPDDRLAIVLIRRQSRGVIQRLVTADDITYPQFMAWLRQKNAESYDVYVSMNALQKNARGRTRAEIGAIRHIYLDFDENATAAVERLLTRRDLPKPTNVLNTSPDKWQVAWRVEGFAKEKAERLQRGLARETGADIAATDISRVLRLPGFFNHKYDPPCLVRAEARSAIGGEIYRSENFPEFGSTQTWSATSPGPRHKLRVSRITQSERDWSYAKRALARGEPDHLVAASIANHRRFEKHNPQYYAELTVRKAAESLAEDRAESLQR